LPTGTANTAYTNTQFVASGTDPITWSNTGALPSGMTFSSSGLLSGTPTVSANSSITFTATNAYGSNNSVLTLSVNAANAFATPVSLIAPTIETVISGATINQVGTMLRVKRGGWPATPGWTLDWTDPAAAYTNPGIPTVDGTSNTVRFALQRRYQWLRDGVEIPSENTIVYTLTNEDAGKAISVRESVTRVVPNVGNTAFVESATVVSATSSTVTGISGSVSSSLVYKNNLTYLGTFKIHNAYYDVPSIINTDNLRAIAFDPNGDSGNGSLYVMSGNTFVTSEVRIPATLANGFSTSYNSLPDGVLLQTPRNATDGWLASTNPSAAVYGQLVYGNNLIQSAGNIYSGEAPNITHAKRSKTLSVVGVTGTSLVNPSSFAGNGRWLAGPMCLIPTSWQTALDGKAITGWAGTSVNSNITKGPPAYSFDPDLIGTGNVTAQTLLSYSNSYPLDAESQKGIPPAIFDANGSQAPLWTALSFSYGQYGMCIPDGTSSILYFGPHSVGIQSYGNQTGYGNAGVDAYYGGGSFNLFDPSGGTNGPSSGTYAFQCWAFNLNDLASVKSGSLLPYDVKPYAVWSMSLPGVTTSSTNAGIISGRNRDTLVCGAIYDSIRKRIYVCHQNYQDGTNPVVSVFSVSNAA
jgi:hypothetical protein